MGKLKQAFTQKINMALGKVPAREGANGYVGDDPHKVQPTKAPTTSTGTNTGTSTQMKKKNATGSTGSGVNII